MTVNSEATTRFRPLRAYARLAALSLAAAVACLVIGYFPTRALGGGPAISAMGLGVGIALIAALAGLIPTIISLRASPRAQVSGTLLGMALRFALTLALLLAGLLGGTTARVPLAIWVVIGYLLLVTIDTAGLVWLNKLRARTGA